MKKAFSLVELSIVLVILGLLTGGILTGKSLIRAAEVRNIATSHQKYQSAFITFREKYFAIPGDMRNATDFWGIRAGTGSDATCETTPATSRATCNGTGDGIIYAAGPGGTRASERYNAWQHLVNAGLIEGNYTGVGGIGGTTHSVPGENVPSTKISGVGATMAWLRDMTAGHSIFHERPYGYHILEYGYPKPTGTTRLPFLSPEEAWNIDTKIDDGRAGLGKVFVLKSTAADMLGCSTTDVPTTTEYNLSNESIVCGIIISLGA